MRNLIPVIRPLTVAVFSVLLASCAVGPDYVRPNMDTGDHFVRQGMSVAEASGEDKALSALSDDADFWQALGDPQLSVLIEQTLLANHDLRSALSRYDEANALLRGAKFDHLPTLTAQANASDTRLSADQSPGASREARDVKSYDGGFLLSWEIDLFGRVRRNVESKHAEADALAADLRALQVKIVAEVASEYIKLRGLQERLQVAKQNAQIQTDTLRLVDAGLAAGRGTEFDAVRVRAQLESTSARVPALEAQIAFSEHRLAVLSGKPPGALIAELDTPKALPGLPTAFNVSAPAELLRRRPDVAAAEYRLHSSTAKIGVATADLFPRITLGGLFGSQGASSSGLFERDSEHRIIALGIDWSFLDVGRVRSRIAASKAGAAGELARYQQTVLIALEDTENALVRYDKAREEDEFQQRAAIDSNRAAALARTRFEGGVGTLLEVLDAQRTNLQAQDELAQSRARTLNGLILLYRAMAGGWPTRLPERQEVADAIQPAASGVANPL